VAPTIKGHDIVKKGLLMMMAGGVKKETIDGQMLR
jgi:DNA replicative helicase MCM subunit Mcm2 (Cdc46/Mcm family)